MLIWNVNFQTLSHCPGYINLHIGNSLVFFTLVADFLHEIFSFVNNFSPSGSYYNARLVGIFRFL